MLLSASCSNFTVTLNTVILALGAPAELTPAHSAWGFKGEKSMMEQPGPIRWAPAGTDLSPAHLPPAVGPQRAEIALTFSCDSCRGGKENRKKVERKRKCIPCCLTSAAGITVQKQRISISKNSLKIKGNKNK